MKVSSLVSLQTLLDSPDGLINNVEGTNAYVLNEELRNVASVLSTSFGVEFSYRFDDQDRTDFGQITIPRLLCIPLVDWPPEIRFSYHWPLVTIFQERLLANAALDSIIKKLEELGYIFAPESLFMGSPDEGFERHSLWSKLFDYD